jgi:hypothetical protein
MRVFEPSKFYYNKHRLHKFLYKKCEDLLMNVFTKAD